MAHIFVTCRRAYNLRSDLVQEAADAPTIDLTMKGKLWTTRLHIFYKHGAPSQKHYVAQMGCSVSIEAAPQTTSDRCRGAALLRRTVAVTVKRQQR